MFAPNRARVNGADKANSFRAGHQSTPEAMLGQLKHLAGVRVWISGSEHGFRALE